MHPAIVHLPLGIAFLLPLLVAGALLTKDRWRTSWRLVVVAQAVVAIAASVAYDTGGDEEEIVEDVVPQAAIHEHEENAEAFLWLAWITLAAAVAGVALPKEKLARGAAMATGVLTLAQAGAGALTGHAGGELVFEHDAAAAHHPGAPEATEPAGHEDDD